MALFLLYAPLAFRVSSHQHILVAYRHNGAILPPCQPYAIIRKEGSVFVDAANMTSYGARNSTLELLGASYPMHVVTLYAKAGCHLCDEARAYLEDALADIDQTVDLREADIRTNPALFERYRYRIPVIAVDGIERLEGRVTDEAVRELLRSLSR